MVDQRHRAEAAAPEVAEERQRDVVDAEDRDLDPRHVLAADRGAGAVVPVEDILRALVAGRAVGRDEQPLGDQAVEEVLERLVPGALDLGHEARRG